MAEKKFSELTAKGAALAATDLVDGLGELIVDALTANRSLSAIPSASAILDTSNYTFHAITYGKNADGFRKHGHVILSPSGADNGL